MKRFAKLPLIYAVSSSCLSLLVLLLLMMNPSPATGLFSRVIFFSFVGAYFNCLPLAIVGIFLFFRKETRRYSLFAFASIILVLYFVVKVFGRTI